MRLSLVTKIVVLAALPVAAFIVAESYLIREAWKARQSALAAAHGIASLVELSNTVNEMQRERGRTGLYINGTLTKVEIEAARLQTSKALTKFEATLPPELDSESAAAMRAVAGRLAKLRERADNKEPIPAVAAAYTELIGSALNYYQPIASLSEEARLGGAVKGMTILEEAKESAGRLRATISPVLANDKPIGKELRSRITKLKLAIDISLASPALHVSPAGAQEIKDLAKRTHWQKVSNVVEKVLDRSEVGNYEEDAKAFFGTITAAVDDLSVLVKSELAAIISSANDRSTTATALFSTLVAVGALVSGGLLIALWFLTRSTSRILKNVLAQLSLSSSRVTGASSQLEAGSSSLANSASSAAAALEETSASIEEISSVIQTSSDNASQADSLAFESTKIANIGNKSMQELLEGMKQIAASSEKVNSIVSLIDSIAFQTNLLALNAAVEAARAGDHGKGFAVVAEEVRTLAQRSSDAAKEITDLVADTVRASNQGMERVNRGSEIFSKMLDANNRVQRIVSEIAAAAKEQSIGIGQISIGIEELNKATQQNAAVSEEASASAKELLSEAEQLDVTMKRLEEFVNGHQADGRPPVGATEPEEDQHNWQEPGGQLTLH